MRKRSIAFLALALIAWLVFWHLVNALTRGGFAYELGSVAFPMALHIRLGITAELLSLVGLLLLTVDFACWVRERRR